MSNIQSQRWLLSRRQFLRGAGACLSLPLLDAMTPLRLSAAQAAAGKPRRSVFVYIPNVMLTMLQKMEVSAEKFVDSLGPVLEIV